MLEGMDLIIFDLDGVLIDTKQLYLYALQQSFAKYGYNYSYGQIEPLLGKRATIVISELIPKKDNEGLIGKIKKNFDKICKEEGVSRVTLFPYVRESVEKLKKMNFKLVICTNNYRFFVDDILKKFSLISYWNRRITTDDGFKDKVNAITFLINHFKTTPSKSVYIADTVNDIKTARKVGCKIIAIPGYNSENMLREAKPDKLIRNLKELFL